MIKMLKHAILLLLAVMILSTGFAQISSDDIVCGVYITGIGCPHCARADPVLLVDKLAENPELVIIEYEIYQERINAEMIMLYNSEYGSGFGVPLLIIGKNNYIAGDRPIINNIQSIIDNGPNPCPLIQGPTSFDNLNFSNIPRSPKIWRDDRVLIADGKDGNNEFLHELLLSESVSQTLSGTNHTMQGSRSVAYSGGIVNFNNSAKINGWIIAWNECHENNETIPCTEKNATRTNQTASDSDQIHTAGGFSEQLTITKLITLAAVDAVNPCAIAVLTLMLIAILTYNPTRKRKVLFAGLAFSTSVFFMYLFYGLVIIRFFQVIQALTTIRLTLYYILGVAAIILGVLNIKDYIKYTPGGLGTEMPMFLRPHAKKLINEVTSPRGAFIVGLFITIFLLPCTIGPYVIAGGILSALEIINTIPLLMIYNFIFVTPMLVITAVVYTGMAQVKDVSEWKKKHVRKLHLIAGIIMAFIGIAMILGWV